MANSNPVPRSKIRKPVSQRLAEKLERKPSGCIEWVAPSTARGGYGVIFWDGKQKLAHRVAWELTNGPIPDGVSVCHRCDNPPCCNVDHLFLGTHAENMADRDRKGRGKPGCGRHSLEKTTCPQGHPYDAENTYVTREGWRACRICRADASRRRTQREAARRQARRAAQQS